MSGSWLSSGCACESAWRRARGVMETLPSGGSRRSWPARSSRSCWTCAGGPLCCGVGCGGWRRSLPFTGLLSGRAALPKTFVDNCVSAGFSGWKRLHPGHALNHHGSVHWPRSTLQTLRFSPLTGLTLLTVQFRHASPSDFLKHAPARPCARAARSSAEIRRQHLLHAADAAQCSTHPRAGGAPLPFLARGRHDAL